MEKICLLFIEKEYGYNFTLTWHIKRDNVSLAAIVAGNRARIALWLECIPVFVVFESQVPVLTLTVYDCLKIVCLILVITTSIYKDF